MTFISSVLCYKVFTDERIFREDFLIKQKMEKWMLIIDKVIPSSVFITKFNPREETIELSQSNQKAKNQFEVKNSEQLQTFMAKTFLDKNSEATLILNNSTQPNNLKKKIRTLIEREKINNQKKLYQKRIQDNVQKMKSIGDINSHNNNNKILQQANTITNMLNFKNRSRIDSKNSVFTDQQTPYSLENSRKISNNGNQNMNNIPLPFRNLVMKNKRNKESYGNIDEVNKNNSLPLLAQNQINENLEQENLNNSYTSQPVQRKGRRMRTIRNRQYIIKNQENPSQNSNQISENINNNNFILGYYRKDELSEQQTFSIKLYSYYLEEIYVIVVIDEESYEQKMIREKNKLREFQLNSIRFVNELSQQAKNMFAELRNLQISYINLDNSQKESVVELKEQNLKAINYCFAIINNIDNHIISNSYIPTNIVEEDIKEIDLNQLISNLLQVLQIHKDEKNLKCVIYNIYKERLQSSSKYLTQLLYNILNLSFQICADQGLVQIEIKEVNKTFYTSYIEFCIKHTLKDDLFSIFNFNEDQKLIFETSKKLLEFISPYSKFFIKQRKNFYAQIKFYLYKDLNEINVFNRTRQTMLQYTLKGNEGNHLIEQEECLSEDLSIDFDDVCANKMGSHKETNKNTRNALRTYTTQRQNTDQQTKLTQEQTDEDIRQRKDTYLSQQSRCAPQITSSVFVEGISGYKIPFGKLFAEQQKENQYQVKQQMQYHHNDDQEGISDDYECDEDQEETSKVEDFNTNRQIETKVYRQRNSNNKKLGKMQRDQDSSKEQSEENKIENDEQSQNVSKKRFSSRLDTRNTSQRSQYNIRSKKNSCFNENNNEANQLYFHERQISSAIREDDEEITLTKSNNSNFNQLKIIQNDDMQNNSEFENKHKMTPEQFNSPSTSIHTDFIHENKDEIKEIIQIQNSKLKYKEKSIFQSRYNKDNEAKNLLSEQ
ncbi:hypothetical protein TTHERM_00420180 (macronuclear) [Tetrahymena thermophila SB210]|uniref:Uncharacterized protein n=1 Tax=Tetrahymena thermophila (strain SB210) TaxID=312017 RepID=I7MD71_TETTS|nr:hypothetical protein TTHERM_00420180 [Tetrahymena thermophila SB210]EAR85610.2 hypothetical protein TTHERM_00420180 [Tetrahymena thermophila SB210]|eukprot:XP_001033273.2 hypothetical protein TTHERM_00420180 [Tetrahymena thermophila SB210]